MYRFKNSLIALVGVLTLVAIVTVAAPHIGRGASGSSTNAPTTQAQNVKVVNAPSEPVPIQGSVSPGTGTLWNVGVVGTPNVAVSNFPATTNVGIDPVANTVKIDPANPLGVRDSGDPARTAFHFQAFADFDDGFNTAQADLTVVPAGHRLVIRSVSMSLRLPKGSKVLELSLDTAFDGNSLVPLYLVPTLIASDDTFDYYVVSQPVLEYAGAGTLVEAHVIRDTNIGSWSAGLVAVSGYSIECGVGPGCPAP